VREREGEGERGREREREREREGDLINKTRWNAKRISEMLIQIEDDRKRSCGKSEREKN
jgi:hypothetical protein